MAHAYLFVGDVEEGISRARTLAGTAEVHELRCEALSVDDTRALIELAHRAAPGGRWLIIAVRRVFREAQNALLKLTEDPPANTTIVLTLESDGDVLPTLRSRLAPLPGAGSRATPALAEEFAKGSAAAREKLVARILNRAKSDTREEKQSARADALALAQGLSRIVYERGDDIAFLRDLDRVMPILHESAAPLKPILEHILITAPKDLTK